MSLALWVPLQKYICAKHVLHTYCAQCNACANCAYVQNVRNLHLYVLHEYCIYASCIYAFCTHSAHVFAVQSMRMLHICILHTFCTYISCAKYAHVAHMYSAHILRTLVNHCSYMIMAITRTCSFWHGIGEGSSITNLDS